jgi:hypothetical protein
VVAVFDDEERCVPGKFEMRLLDTEYPRLELYTHLRRLAVEYD